MYVTRLENTYPHLPKISMKFSFQIKANQRRKNKKKFKELWCYRPLQKEGSPEYVFTHLRNTTH